MYSSINFYKKHYLLNLHDFSEHCWNGYLRTLCQVEVWKTALQETNTLLVFAERTHCTLDSGNISTVKFTTVIKTKQLHYWLCKIVQKITNINVTKVFYLFLNTCLIEKIYTLQAIVV